MVKLSKKRYWKMRQQARLIVANVGTSLFLRAQDHICPICQNRLAADDLTIDHVWPLQDGSDNYGNIFLCHYDCNQEKGDRLPTDFEIEMLDKINQRLGYDPLTGRYQCRQTLVSKYYKTTLWLNELRERNASRHEIARVELKLAALGEHVSQFIVR